MKPHFLGKTMALDKCHLLTQILESENEYLFRKVVAC